mgnify:CR=1 FL=1|tara:strand:+ start:70 stop:618 length:549 start_codon:yes stop_codon:yes gene_type:complete
MILEANKLIFIHPPRCSGTSIEESMLNGKLVPDSEKHLNAKQIKDIVKDEWNSYFKFSIVRNPWDRVISMYHSRHYALQGSGKYAGRSLKYFLENLTTPKWEYGLQCSDYINLSLDFIIKFENRQQDIETLNNKYNLFIDNNIVARKNKGRHADYKKYYNKETIKRVSEMFSEDIKQFNYKY